MLSTENVHQAASAVRLIAAEGTGGQLERVWDGAYCRSRLRNDGSSPLRLREVVLASGPLTAAPETTLYGEGFQMLSQTAGTVGQPQPLGKYTDAGHYLLAQPDGAWAAYGLAMLSDGGSHILLGFTSCRRFIGAVRFFVERYEVVLDLEGLTLGPGEAWDLEEFGVLAGEDREALLATLAARIARHHPKLAWAGVPTGWCSWYWYGPSVSEDTILANLRTIAGQCPDLRYIQIDDGYQAHMGDWLEPGERFPNGMRALCGRIQEAGFEPAMWVAPFIASGDSRLAQEHPDWLIQDGQGRPLSSGDISFGGWRHGPWYMLDGTHPGAQEYVTHVFAVMRQEWGCRYFKLDANVWGILPGGVRHDAAATRVEAYRRGMAAVRRGAGADSFLLGCNAPMWASLGEVHGMRVSDDVNRTWDRVTRVARQCFYRNWQHGRLWINDPDCLVLANKPGRSPLSEDERQFHASAVLATGGMVLDGDDTRALTPSAWQTIRRLLPPLDHPARFSSVDFQEGVITLSDRQLICLFNWTDLPRPARFVLPVRCTVTDYWTGAAFGAWQGEVDAGMLPAHAARVFACVPC